MKSLVCFLLTCSAALATPGEYLFERESSTSPFFPKQSLAPVVGNVLTWTATGSTGRLANLDIAATYAALAHTHTFASLTGKPATLAGYGITDAPTGSGTSTGTNTGDNAVNSLYSGLVSNATHTGDATGSTALTLATVNANVGTFGGATKSLTATVNGKGLVTALAEQTVTPAVGSITGFGTGISTALAINTGTSGSVQLNNGSGAGLTGTASSLTAGSVTNLTLGGATTISTGGTIALGGFTLTAPATGTAALLGTANTFTAAQTNSTAGAASLPAAKWTGVPFAGTGTTSFPLVYINDANATASTTLNTAGTYFGVNGDGTQDLFNFLKDGASQMRLNSLGELSIGGTALSGFEKMRVETSHGYFSVRSDNPIQFQLRPNSGKDGWFGFTENGIADRWVVGITNGSGTLKFRADGTSGTDRLTLTNAGLLTATSLAVTGASTLSGTLITTPDSLSGAGAVSVTTSATALTSTGVAQALTLANGTNGQIKTIVHDVDGGSSVLTPSTKTGFSTVTFTNAGDTVTLQYFTTRGWMVLASYGAVVAP